MKLHATILNENGKTVSKGGNEMLRVELKRGNEYLGYIYLTNESIVIDRPYSIKETIHLGNLKS